MCGIAGILKLKGDLQDEDLKRLDQALAAQGHRGPDATASWSNERVALGHNRLSILDLSTAANQPFHREDLGLTVIFNGEIYNFQKLKDSLLEEGFEFFTTSDTEVLLAAYRHFGKHVCEHLVGMFAFVIYDWRSEEVFAARDRFGEKPFLYIQTETEYLFASELHGLAKLYARELQINHEAVVDLMENMYINSHHTIYQEVRNFQPGCSLTIQGTQVTWNSYYKFPTKVNHKPGFEALKTQVKSLLQEIVNNELHADVPVATFLSSGIDSSVITAFAKELKPDILAITMATGDPRSDESKAAAQFAKKLNIRQEIVTVDPGSLRVLARLFQNIQPLADASLIPTHLVTEAVASHTKVMLSGDAGDEVFGSYNRPNLYQKFGQKPIPGGGGIISALMSVSGSNWEKYLSDKNRFRLGGWEGYYLKNNLSGCFSKVFSKGKKINQVAVLAKNLASAYDFNPEKLSFGVDLISRLPGDFLFKVDAASMHSSLEVRAPFLDHRLVDISLTSDLDSLMPKRIDKEITRSIYRDFAGYEHQGSKKGFSIPYMNYLKGEWGTVLEGFLKEGISAQYFHFNTKGLLAMLEELRKSPRQSLARVLFSVLVLEIWLRVFHLRQELTFSFDSK